MPKHTAKHEISQDTLSLAVIEVLMLMNKHE